MLHSQKTLKQYKSKRLLGHVGMVVTLPLILFSIYTSFTTPSLTTFSFLAITFFLGMIFNTYQRLYSTAFEDNKRYLRAKILWRRGKREAALAEMGRVTLKTEQHTRAVEHMTNTLSKRDFA